MCILKTHMNVKRSSTLLRVIPANPALKSPKPRVKHGQTRPCFHLLLQFYLAKPDPDALACNWFKGRIMHCGSKCRFLTQILQFIQIEEAW